MKTIAIIDYGMGNLHSVAKAMERVAPSHRIIVTEQIQDIQNAERILFPGVGAIRDCMNGLKRLHLDQAIMEAIQTKPVLAICVGMQALMDFDEENDGVECLGVLPGQVKYFGEGLADNDGSLLKIPHMGWNQVNQKMNHPLWQGIEQNSRFYFVHSYYVEPAKPEQLAGETEYGHCFAAALAKDNLFAVQFHPEKSQHDGLKLLENFANWTV